MSESGSEIPQDQILQGYQIQQVLIPLILYLDPAGYDTKPSSRPLEPLGLLAHHLGPGVSDQGCVNCLYQAPWTLQQLEVHACVGRGSRPSSRVHDPRQFVSVAVGIQRAWRHPGRGQPLHHLDVLLRGSGYQQSEHAAFVKYKTDPFPSIRWLRQCTCFYFFQQNKSLHCSTACIDLESKL